MTRFVVRTLFLSLLASLPALPIANAQDSAAKPTRSWFGRLGK